MSRFITRLDDLVTFAIAERIRGRSEFPVIVRTPTEDHSIIIPYVEDGAIYLAVPHTRGLTRYPEEVCGPYLVTKAIRERGNHE